MTVSTQQNRASFAGDGVSSQFDFAFPFAKASHIRVFLKNAAGVVSELASNAFSLTQPGGGIGGRVTLTSIPPVGTRVTIVRIPEPLQETDLLENDAFFAETLERQFDYLAMMDQRHADILSRALVLGEADLPGAGQYQAGGNRLSGLADAILATDAPTLSQVQAIVAAGGGSGGGGGPVEPGPATWPTTPIPQSVLDQINANPGLLDLFAPLNTSVGNLSSTVLSLNSSVASINTTIGNIQLTTTDLQDQIDLLSSIGGDVSGIITLIQTEETARIAQDTAIAQTIARIGAADSDSSSFIINLATAKIGPTETLGARLSAITVSQNAANAAITTEQTARIAGDTILSQTVARIGALSGDGTAFIINLDTARVGPTETLAQRFTGITSAVNGANAAITTEASTRAAADSSISSTVSTLQSTLGSNVLTIQQNTTAINGINAKYTVKIDNNGHVSGFGLISEANNGAIVSTFNVLANVFRIVDPAGGLTTPLVPFSVSGGVVTMQNIVVTNALIQSLAVSKITAGALGADVSLGAGKITLAAGGRSMFLGSTGIGASNEYVQWFGTTPGSAAGATDGAATFYIKNNGDAFFGGTLAANVVTATNIQAGAVTNTVTDIAAGPTTYSPSPAGVVTRSASITVLAGTKVQVLFSATVNGLTGATIMWKLTLRRGGTALQARGFIANAFQSCYVIAVDSPPSAGTYTYDVTIEKADGTAGSISLYDMVLGVTELKR